MKQHKGVHYFVIVVVALTMLAPIFFTLIYSCSKAWLSIVPNDFPTLTYWKELFTSSPDFWADIGRSLIICIVPIVVSVVAIVMAMYSTIMYYPRLDAVIQTISMIPYTVRGIVLAISVLTLYAGKGTIFSNRLVMLFCVYSVVILPFVYRGIRNNLYAINVKQIVEAAELLGASGLYTFFWIIVPNILSGILVSALLAFGAIFTDYAVIKLIAGTRYETAQTYIYIAQKSKTGSKAATYIIAVFIVIFIVAMTSYSYQNRKDKEKNAVVNEEPAEGE